MRLYRLTSVLLTSLLFTLNTQAQQGMGVGNNNPQEMLDVSGAIKLGTNLNTNPGTIRWTGSDFEGHTVSGWVSLTGGGGTDDQNLTSASFSGNTLTINIENGNSISVDMSQFDDDTDADADVTNELITGATLSGTNLNITDAGGTQTVDLSSLNNSGTDDQNLTGATLTGTSLEITIEGGSSTTVDLSSLVDDEDWTVAGNDIYNANSGNVGINTNNPSEELTLGGDMRIVQKAHSAGRVGNLSTVGSEIRALEFYYIPTAYSPLSVPMSKISTKNYNTTGSGWYGSAGRVDAGLSFYTSLNGSLQEQLTINHQGRIGIGTTSPEDKLHVEGNIRMVDGNQAAGYIPVSDANGTMTWTDPNTIVVADDGDWTVNGNDQYSTVSGNVGIGTSSPASKLQIQDNASGLNFPLFLRNTSANVGDGTGIGFLSEPNGDWVKAGVFHERTAGFGVGKLHFLVDDGADNQSATLAETRMTITPQGNVGIGETSPSEKLDVAGSIRMVDGNQAAGYIPVSDANGTMTWTDPITISTAADGDGDATNEFQDLSNASSGTDRTINISNGTGTTISVADNDNDASNEIQTLSVSGNDVSLSNGGGTVSIEDGDWTVNGNDQHSAVSGNIGVGTASPDAKLHVAPSSGNVGIQVDRVNGVSSIEAGTTGSNWLMADGNVANDGRVGINFYSGGNVILANGGGNVGIGTTSPADKLHVAGSIRMVDGNQAAGFIPVSDANGTMTWTDPTAISDGDWTVSGNDQYSSVSGNVGVGTTTPEARLHVAPSSGVAVQVDRANNSPSIEAGTTGSSWLIADGNVATDGKVGINHYSGGNVILANGGGNVGVGTSSPTRKLHVLGSSALFTNNASSQQGIEIFPMVGGNGDHGGGRIFFREDDSDEFGFSVGYNGGQATGALLNWPSNSFVIARHSNNATGNPVFVSNGVQTGIGGVINPNNTLDVDGEMVIGSGYAGSNNNANAPNDGLLVEGIVGIGITNPWHYGKLTVSGTANSSSVDYGWFNSNGNSGTTSGATRSYSIWATGRIRASEFNAMSDARAKTIVQRTNTAKMLELINKLTVTEYAYVDSIEHGSKSKQGFIAQEIEAVYPNAVSSSTDYVPSIFSRSKEVSYDVNEQLATISVEKEHQLTTADKVKLMLKDGTVEAEVEAVIDANTFTVKLEAEPKHVFVYGKQVDDFRAVDYDQVFSIGVAAIQELSNTVEELSSKVETLETENAELKAEKTSNEERFQRIEEQLQIGLKAQK